MRDRGDRVFTAKKDGYLKQVYRTNPKTNAFIVDISLDNYNEIFNDWDPSPAGRRDLDPELLAFMENCSSDIPLRFPLELQFHMPQSEFNEEKEHLSKQGLKHYMEFIAHSIDKHYKDGIRKAMIYALAAFLFLTLGYFPKQIDGPKMLASILTEAITIVGWVLLWQAFSQVFFSGQEIRKKQRVYKRFLDAAIVFTYEPVEARTR